MVKVAPKVRCNDESGNSNEVTEFYWKGETGLRQVIDVLLPLSGAAVFPSVMGL